MFEPLAGIPAITTDEGTPQRGSEIRGPGNRTGRQSRSPEGPL